MSTVLTDEQREMVLANVPLVEHIVNRVAANLPANHSRDDLVQTGIMGLISATVRYDPGVGAAFSTYAGRRIEGAIIDLLRRNDWAPRSVRQGERRLNAAEERATVDHSATVTELARELNCTVAELHRLRNDIAKARLDSLDRPVRSDDTPIPLGATVPDDRRRAEDKVADDELVGYLRNGVALLPERHRTVIVGFFFEGRSVTELGALLGVTQSRASQLKDEAIRMLREGLRQAYGDGDGAADERRASPPTPLTARQRAYAEAVASSRPWEPAPGIRPSQPPPSSRAGPPQLHQPLDVPPPLAASG